LAIKLKNQCNIIIGDSLAPDHLSEKNGELLFLKTLAGKVKVFIDVGANKGEWTEDILALNPQAEKGILLEPNPGCMMILKNKFGSSQGIEILEMACSDQSGGSIFFAEPDGGETSSLSSSGTNNATKIEVRVTTIDELVNERTLHHIDYLKIDVEGFDLHVIKGASETLRKGIIDVIQFEYNKTWRNNGSTLYNAFSILESYGYKTFCLTKKGLINLDINKYGEFYAYSNFISMKE